MTKATLSSTNLAILIVQALQHEGIIADKDQKFAIEISTEEIDVRKAAGDYPDRLESTGLANLIVDALMYPNIVADDTGDNAAEIAVKIINERKVIGDY